MLTVLVALAVLATLLGPLAGPGFVARAAATEPLAQQAVVRGPPAQQGMASRTLAQRAAVAGPLAKRGPAGGPRVVSKAAVLADEATGQVLFERDAGAPRAMASTTKVMTALLALEQLDERRVVTIGSGPPKVGEESLRLRRGERLTVRQLLLGLLVKSANDAGVALAEAVDGSQAAFVRRMNRRAASLRLTATHYVTPYGLDRPGHQTSARDLAHLWEVAMRRADFRSLVATRAARIPGRPLSLRRFVTSNQLLGSYRWTVGGKTGYTNRAGRCLVASASRGGRRLVAVALGSPDAFADMRALFEYGFSRYVRARLASRGQPVSQAPGRPAAYQADADADALVRIDQLDQVRLTLTGSATGTSDPSGGGSGAAGGTPGTTGAGAGSAGGDGTGSTDGAAGGGGTAWFTVGGRRLVGVRVVRLAGGGPVPTTTPAASALPGGGPGTTSTTTPAVSALPGGGPGPTSSTVLTAPATAAGTPGTLTVGAAVQLRPVPPGAAAPVIDPLLRRAPP